MMIIRITTYFLPYWMALLCAFSAVAHTQPDYYFNLQHIADGELLQKGLNYEMAEHIDSAAHCFTVIINRPETADSVRDQAHVHMAKIYLFYYFDYPNALNHLQRAQHIEMQLNIENPQTYLTLQSLYQNINNDLEDPVYTHLILDYGRKALHSAIAQHDELAAGIAFINSVSSALSVQMMDSVADMWSVYSSHQPLQLDTLHAISSHFYQAAMAMNRQQWDKAIDAFDQMRKSIPQHFEGYNRERILLMILDNLSSIYMETGQLTQALATVREMERLSLQEDFKDALLLVYDRYANIFELTGDRNQYLEYAIRHTALKDSLLGQQQTMRLSKITFDQQVSEIELQLEQLRHRHQLQTVYLVVGATFLLIVLAFTAFMVRKNRQLNQRNLALYEKNVVLMESERTERLSRARLEQLLEESRMKQEQTDDEQDEKYKDSPLTDEDKLRLQGLIQNVLDTPDVICRSGFTVDQLAQIIGSQQKFVSQVISECFGSNFNILLNDHRAKEACRRISEEPNYLQLTVEGMAKDVGIRSRNTFTAAFRRVTGLTPSEYIRQARQAHHQ